MLSDISESRNVSEEKLNEVADKMLMFYPAEDCVEYGLADTLIYKNDVRNYLKTLIGIDKKDHMPVLTLKDMINVKRMFPKIKAEILFAVYYAYGDIYSGSSVQTTKATSIQMR